MYTPKHFEEPSVEVLHRLMRDHPLATLVTLSADGLNANHIPLHLAPEPTPFGTLRGHVARANPVWEDLAKGAEVLAIFHAADAYITPSWYPTKADTGKVVPTWNYAVAHAYGKPVIIEDAADLRSHLRELTEQHESAFPRPWRLDDAPAGYIDQLMRAIVGIEIRITRLQGKFKAGQNHPPENRAGAVRGLMERGDAKSTAMAALMKTPPGGHPHNDANRGHD